MQSGLWLVFVEEVSVEQSHPFVNTHLFTNWLLYTKEQSGVEAHTCRPSSRVPHVPPQSLCGVRAVLQAAWLVLGGCVSPTLTRL